MQSPIPSDTIRLRLRKSIPGGMGEETVVTLTNKLNDLFGAGYIQDDIYGLVIPLLMQGKVRIDLDDRSERLELEDHNLRFQRTNAIQVFEDYLLARKPEKLRSVGTPNFSDSV